MSQDQNLQFFAQADSNLVIYWRGLANWAVRRDRFAGIPSGRTQVGSYLVMQNDGNLVVYDASGRPTWWVSKPNSGFVQLRR